MWLDFTDELSQQSLLISVQMKIKFFYFNEMCNNLDSLPKFLFENIMHSVDKTFFAFLFVWLKNSGFN